MRKLPLKLRYPSSQTESRQPPLADDGEEALKEFHSAFLADP
jgi:hypothetical protein